MAYNIFVLGLDDLNLETLQHLPNAEDYRFHRLLTIEELQHQTDIPLNDLLHKAAEQLRGFDGPIDAIVGYWDFPISSMVPILCAEFGLPSASLESVVKCEHKYWSRLEQRKVITELPRFTVVDPYDDEALQRLDMDYPYWIKPVKAFSSELAHRIDGPGDLERAIPALRSGITRVGHPFDEVLAQVEDLPAEIAKVGGEACLVESAVGGHQATVEGYSNGGVYTYGVVDSIPCPGLPSFERFQYPSRLPEATQRRMADVARRVISQLGLRRATFNIEFFWDPDTDELNLLEVNPRHSQSHAKLFEHVDGLSNHQLMIDLALGRQPHPPQQGLGPDDIAAKCFLRHFEDGVVTRCPTPAEVEDVERDVPGTTIHVIVSEGDRLADLHDQDAYSFKIADIYIGARTEQELTEKFRACRQALPFEFAPVR